MKATYRWKNKGYLNFQKNVASINGQSVKYGFFDETGDHPENPGINAPTLMGMHELRLKDDMEKRPVIQVALNTWGDQINRASEKEFRILMTVINRSSIKLDNLLSAIARVGCRITKDVFGDSALLDGNTLKTMARKGNRNTPMVEFGYLRDSLAFKTSVTNKVTKT